MRRGLLGSLRSTWAIKRLMKQNRLSSWKKRAEIGHRQTLSNDNMKCANNFGNKSVRLPVYGYSLKCQIQLGSEDGERVEYYDN